VQATETATGLCPSVLAAASLLALATCLTQPSGKLLPRSCCQVSQHFQQPSHASKHSAAPPSAACDAGVENGKQRCRRCGVKTCWSRHWARSSWHSALRATALEELGAVWHNCVAWPVSVHPSTVTYSVSLNRKHEGAWTTRAALQQELPRTQATQPMLQDGPWRHHARDSTKDLNGAGEGLHGSSQRFKAQVRFAKVEEGVRGLVDIIGLPGHLLERLPPVMPRTPRLFHGRHAPAEH